MPPCPVCRNAAPLEGGATAIQEVRADGAEDGWVDLVGSEDELPLIPGVHTVQFDAYAEHFDIASSGDAFESGDDHLEHSDQDELAGHGHHEDLPAGQVADPNHQGGAAVGANPLAEAAAEHTADGAAEGEQLQTLSWLATPAEPTQVAAAPLQAPADAPGSAAAGAVVEEQWQEHLPAPQGLPQRPQVPQGQPQAPCTPAQLRQLAPVPVPSVSAAAAATANPVYLATTFQIHRPAVPPVPVAERGSTGVALPQAPHTGGSASSGIPRDPNTGAALPSGQESGLPDPDLPRARRRPEYAYTLALHRSYELPRGPYEAEALASGCLPVRLLQAALAKVEADLVYTSAADQLLGHPIQG